MVLFNHATREMTAKIVYYGPGLCGKTTNLLVIYDKLDANAKGKMLSLATRSDRTLFFDLLPVDIGKLGTFNLKIQLYTVPGQVFYNETRRLVLRGADSVVFVADSQPSMLDSNRESYENLLENLRENRIDPEDVPIIVQYNKRDIPGVLPVRDIQKAVGLDRFPSIEASALKGEGVMETFRLVSKLTAKKLLARMKGKETAEEEPESENAAPVEELPSPAARPTSSQPEDAFEESPLPEELAASVQDDLAARFQLADIAAADVGPTLRRGGESAPFEEHYDRMEEVSLEQLLEGRDRPLTMRHAPEEAESAEAEESPVEESTVEESPVEASPVEGDDEVEVLTEEDLVDDEPAAAAVAPAEIVPEPPAELPPPTEPETAEQSTSTDQPADEEQAVEAERPAESPVETMVETPAPEETPVAMQASEQMQREVDELRGQLDQLRRRQEEIVSTLTRVVDELGSLIRGSDS
jgi:signal recognition particle receptor subunit beta